MRSCPFGAVQGYLLSSQISVRDVLSRISCVCACRHSIAGNQQADAMARLIGEEESEQADGHGVSNDSFAEALLFAQVSSAEFTAEFTV